MMLDLTLKNGTSILVNSDYVVSVSPKDDGQSVLLMDCPRTPTIEVRESLKSIELWVNGR